MKKYGLNLLEQHKKKSESFATALQHSCYAAALVCRSALNICSPAGLVRLEQNNETFLEMGIYDDGPFEVGDENVKNPDLVPTPPNSYLGKSKSWFPPNVAHLAMTFPWFSRLLPGHREASGQAEPVDRGGGSPHGQPQWRGGVTEKRRGHEQHPGKRLHPRRGRPSLLFWLRSGSAGPEWRQVRVSWRGVLALSCAPS